jgi:vacuolar protein sorting-associated protein 41
MSASKDSPGNGAVKLAEHLDTLSDSPDEMSDREGRTTEGNGHAAVQGERGVGENHNEHTGKGKDDHDEGVEDDEGDDDDDEDDEDNEEPALKYQRIGGALPELLKKDSASALTISNRLMVSSLRSCILICLLNTCT